MRNLKRALSMALASVMLLGMMVVGTSAASYTDVDDNDNVEAIEVLQAVGAMIGSDGKFNPDQGVTRNEMAAIMVNVMDLDTTDYTGTSPFTDVPAWAEPFVAACYANGIVSGTSATTYNGDNGVTVAQAGLMVMKALGYFQYGSDFGSDWQLETVKQADKIDLFKGINAKVTENLTRNEAAQLVLNGLKATMVDAEDNGIGVDTQGNLVSKYKYVEITADSSDAISNKQNGAGKDLVQLGEDLYDGDLELKTIAAGDDFGRPAHKWVYNNEDVIEVSDEADKIIVSEKDYADVAAAYVDIVDEDFTKDGKVVMAEKCNGGAAAAVKPGDVIELFMDDAGNIEFAAVLRYEIAQIEKVDTKVTKADKEDGVSAYITIKGESRVKSTDFAGYDAATYVKDARILYIQIGTEVLASALPETVEGEVDALKGSEARIGGTYYDNLKGVKNGDEGTFYLNMAGQIIDFKGVSNKSTDYIYVYKVTSKGGTNSDGFEDTIKTAWGVLVDGTKVSYVIDSDEAVITGAGVYAYAINEDGEIESKTAKDTIEYQGNAAVVNKDSATIVGDASTVYVDSNTKFIFADVDDVKGEVKTSVSTGYKNVNIAAGSHITTVTDDDDVLYVFVKAENGNLTSDETLAVLLDTKAVETTDSDKKNTFYTYTVAIDGEETTLTWKNTDQVKAASLGKGDIFAYTMDGEYVEQKALTAKALTKATAVTDDYIVAGGQYNLGEESIYTITMEYKKDGVTLDTVTVSAGGSVEKDDMVYFTLDSKDVEILFVIDEIK